MWVRSASVHKSISSPSLLHTLQSPHLLNGNGECAPTIHFNRSGSGSSHLVRGGSRHNPRTKRGGGTPFRGLAVSPTASCGDPVIGVETLRDCADAGAERYVLPLLYLNAFTAKAKRSAEFLFCSPNGERTISLALTTVCLRKRPIGLRSRCRLRLRSAGAPH